MVVISSNVIEHERAIDIIEFKKLQWQQTP